MAPGRVADGLRPVKGLRRTCHLCQKNVVVIFDFYFLPIQPILLCIDSEIDINF